ncbi:addiction module protein [Pedobacter glucosidilyticus]|uniref:addiction module protein n=1 Tax=Pedobacter glucosidilyticus TaxID=1122941 RepID=UPI0004127879|nr:addiction module protein [Pedobacter glucosidilyticus]
MDIQSLKINIIHWITELEDEKLLQEIQDIKQNRDISFISTVQQEELDTRIDEYLKGKTEFRTWDEVKANIRKRHKNAI